MCDGNIDYLACHGTKIGMGIGKAFITPIEQRVNTPQIKSPSKRNDGAFLTDNVCASSQRRKEMNDHYLEVFQTASIWLCHRCYTMYYHTSLVIL